MRVGVVLSVLLCSGLSIADTLPGYDSWPQGKKSQITGINWSKESTNIESEGKEGLKIYDIGINGLPDIELPKHKVQKLENAMESIRMSSDSSGTCEPSYSISNNKTGTYRHQNQITFSLIYFPRSENFSAQDLLTAENSCMDSIVAAARKALGDYVTFNKVERDDVHNADSRVNDDEEGVKFRERMDKLINDTKEAGDSASTKQE